jgi:hypothetical protein
VYCDLLIYSIATIKPHVDGFDIYDDGSSATAYIYSWQGKEVIEYYINELLNEGIVHIPTWSETSHGGAQNSGHGDHHNANVEASNAIGSSGLSVIVSPSSPVGSRGVSRTSTMHLGASANDISCGDEGICGGRYLLCSKLLIR